MSEHEDESTESAPPVEAYAADNQAAHDNRDGDVPAAGNQAADDNRGGDIPAADDHAATDVASVAGFGAQPEVSAAAGGARVDDDSPAAAGATAEGDAGQGSVTDAGPPVDNPVAGALAGLDTLPECDLDEHPEVFERIHGQLHSALSAIDDA